MHTLLHLQWRLTKRGRLVDEGRALGMFGLPNLGVIYKITLSTYRGLFTQAPLLFLAPCLSARVWVKCSDSNAPPWWRSSR